MAAARQIAYRLKSEGKAEVVRDAQEVGQALKDSYDKGVQGADAATAAADRTERKYKAMAAAAQSAAAAQASQNRFNAILGVDVGPAKSARDSAAFYQEFADGEERAARMARELKAQLDPLGAAQDRLNDELKIYDDLAKRGQISTRDLAQAQAQARARFDETSASIARQEKGITKLALAGRLNLARQAGDVFTTAAMGMNPATIAIQQGPQILEALGQAGFKASGGLIVAGGALTAVAAGVVLLAAAWKDGENSAIAYEKAVTGLGRTQGLTASQLRDLSMAAAEQGEITVKAAREQAAAYLATGQIGGDEISKLIALGKDYAAFMGVDAAEATKRLASAMLDPEKAGRDLTRTMGLLNQEQLENIEKMVEQGDLLGAQKILLDQLTAAVDGHADKVGRIENAWDAVGRSISDAITALGEFLYQTEDERIDELRERVRIGRPMGMADSPFGTQQAERQLAVEGGTKLMRDVLAEWRAQSARSNQKDLRDAEVRERREREGEKARREAEAAARRRQAEAERAAREALQRSRREEDRTSGRDMEIARARGDVDELRRLEDANAIRQRTRQLIDDGTDAEKARTQALQEQQVLIDARAAATRRDVEALFVANSVEVDRILGNERLLPQHERHLELVERINAYVAAGAHYYDAWLKAANDLKAVEEAREEVAARSQARANRDWQITLAQARGDRSALRGLDRATWIDNRARELERQAREAGKPMDFGGGDEQAAKDYAELMRAETTGAFRDGLGSLIDDIRSGGLKDALSEQLSRAGDRLIDKLLDAFLQMDFSGGKGGGLGSWINRGMDALFGKNADGTEYWRGGPTWVGERGPELLNLPRGAQVVEHQRSLRMVAASSAPPTINMPISVINKTSEPVSAATRQTSSGIELLLEPAVRGAVQKMGADGSLAKANRLTPRGKTR